MAQTTKDMTVEEIDQALIDWGYDRAALIGWCKSEYGVKGENIVSQTKSILYRNGAAEPYRALMRLFKEDNKQRQTFDTWTEETAPPATATADEKEHAMTLSQPAPPADTGFTDPYPPSIFSLWQENELYQKLDPKTIKQRDGRGNQKFDYLDGSTVFETANRIFGFGMWGYEPVGDYTYREIGAGKLYVGIFVKVWVMGPEGQRSEATDRGSGETTANNAGELEKAEKGAITDGVKRGLVRFGAMFGNELRG